MKVNPVKQFVKDNMLKFELSHHNSLSSRFNLYDKNGLYRGEYFNKTNGSDFLGTEKSRSVTKIFDDNLKQIMQEIVWMDKDYVRLVEPTSDIFEKALPSEITTTVTVLDFLNDKFKTVRTVSKLMNELQRIGNDNQYFKYLDYFIIYEPLNEKPMYEKSVEFVREGSISETKKNPLIYRNNDSSYRGSVNQSPYKYW